MTWPTSSTSGGLFDMDVMPRIFQQFAARFREMPAVQRMMTVAIALAVFVGLIGIVCLNQKSGFQPISFGKVFASDELVSVEGALISQGLTGYRREGQRLLAPEKDLNRYNGVLSKLETQPADLGSQMLKQAESLGPFATDRQRLQMKEALLLQELRRVITSVPDIEDARVAIATSERKPGWNHKSRATANVMVKPRTGREVTPSLVTSLCRVVASMVPDLSPADVTIFDVTRGQAYTGEASDDSTEDQFHRRVRETAQHYEQQIEKALAHIPQVGVVVQVDQDVVKSLIARNKGARERHEFIRVANRPATIETVDLHSTGYRGSKEGVSNPRADFSEQALTDAIPNSINVSISIPRSYVKDIARRRSNGETASQQSDPEAIEEEVIAKVERIAAALLPSETSRDTLSVTCVDRLDAELKEQEKSTSKVAIHELGQRWGSPVGLSILGMMGMWFLRRPNAASTIKMATEDRADRDTTMPDPQAITDEVETTDILHDRMAELRNDVRTLVASDPTAAAEIVRRWLGEAME